MKNLIWILVFGLLVSCSNESSDLDPTIQEDINATGEWTTAQGGGGGFGNYNSYKNFQYNFSVTGNNQVVSINLSSGDIDVQFVLFDPLGQPMTSSKLGRIVQESYTLNEGNYRLVICSDRRAVGKFAVNLVGINPGLNRISSSILQSNTQNWGKAGGGGGVKTFKNHFYTFEVTDDNSTVDIELESPDTEIALFLYDALGTLVGAEQYARYKFLLKAVKKGTYTVMAGTDTRGNIGNYRLNIFGKVQNIQRVASTSDIKTGVWPTGKSEDSYSFEITSANNSPIDIEVSSGETDIWLELQTGAGDRIIFGGNSHRTEYIVSKDLPKGTYRAYMRPATNKIAGATYTLTVNGQFANLKKI